MNLTIFITTNDSKTEYISFNISKKEVEIRSKNWIEWFSFDETNVELDGKEISLEELLKKLSKL